MKRGVNKMKIAFITYLYPNISLGGGSNYAFNLTKEIAKYEDITIFIPKINSDDFDIDTKAVHHLIDTINTPILRSPVFMYRASQELDNAEFDLIHSNAGAGAFLGNTKPFVETFHHWPRGIIPALHGLPMRMCLKKADKIISVSEKSKEEIPLGLCEREKIHVIENGVGDVYSGKIYDDIKEELKHTLDINNEKIILHVNTELSQRKNLPLMLDTVRYLKDKGVDFKLIIIAPKSGEEKVLFQAKQKKVFRQIKYLHMDIPLERMPYYYSIADFIAMPSIQEGFGLPLLEGVAMNKPFVSLNTGIAPKLGELGFGYVADTEIDFKEKCLKMLENPLQITKGKTFVKENYSWKECAKKVLDLYKKIEI